jgi:predicted AAA+ superfamily ATPase
MDPRDTPDLLARLERIADALERLAPRAPKAAELDGAEAFVWHPQGELAPVEHINRIDIGLLKGIDRLRDILVENTERFAQGLPANNALLWGARGMGKSSLVKAVHAQVNRQAGGKLKLIEIHREDIETLPRLMGELRRHGDHRFIVFCDDLSFDGTDTSYKSLKAALEGGIEGRPDNVVLYATSNRRHLLPRDMMENERSTAINPSEAVQEKVSLSDRFGLWLGFHNCSQDEFLAMVEGYATYFKLETSPEALRAAAIEWAATRGSRSGRVAWQFIQDLAGRQGVRLTI